ncbi:unnamed protein product, partial [Ectocarpus sp. 12 AP-2014]
SSRIAGPFGIKQLCERGRASCAYLLDLPNDFVVALTEPSCVVQRATARDSTRTERERARAEETELQAYKLPHGREALECRRARTSTMNALLLMLAVTHQQYAAAFMVMPQAAPSLASGETATSISTSTSSLVGRGGLLVAIDVSSESSRSVLQCASGLPCGEICVCVAAMARPRAASTRLRSRLDVAPPEA